MHAASPACGVERGYGKGHARLVLHYSLPPTKLTSVAGYAAIFPSSTKSTHIVFHDNIHKLTSYMAGHKNFEEHPDKKIKCEMDVVWRQQHNLKREYHL